MPQQIIGLERVLQTSSSGQTWNNKLIRWSIVHNINNQTKPYDIELQMVLLSSKRIVRVNKEIKDTQMCSFGYEAKFEISELLNGEIKQDSLAFELYVNGQSFTKLQESNKTYQPPKLNQGGGNMWEMGNKQKSYKQKIDKKPAYMHHQFIQQKIDKAPSQPLQLKPSKTQSIASQLSSSVKSIEQQVPTPKLQHKPVSSQIKGDKKATESVIKDTQNELMRILMEEKKKKKEEQRLKQSQG